MRPAPTIVGFVGYKGAGKSTAARVIQSAAPQDVVRLSVATPLKKAVCSFLAAAQPHRAWYPDLLGQQEIKAAPWREGSTVTVRHLLEAVGMAVREADPGAQAAIMGAEARRLLGLGYVVVVDDVNFCDEALTVLDLGGTLFYVPGGSFFDPERASDWGVLKVREEMGDRLRTWGPQEAAVVAGGDFTPLYRKE